MGYSPFLPIVGAKVNVLCIPAGPVTPERFQTFIKALQSAADAEITSGENGRTGHIFFDISGNHDRWRPHLFPFETNSRPQVLLGLVDAERLGESSVRGDEHRESRDAPFQELDPISAQFEQQWPAEPGLVVHRLVLFGAERLSGLRKDVLFFPNAGEADAGRQIVLDISRSLSEGVGTIINDLRDKPISMVPGGTTQPQRRAGTSPVPTSGSSTPVFSKPSSPMPSVNGADQQVSLRTCCLCDMYTKTRTERYFDGTLSGCSRHVLAAMRITD
jgi:hypothetical protein